MSQKHILDVLKKNPNKWFTTKMFTRNNQKRNKIARQFRQMEKYGFIELERRNERPWTIYIRLK